MVSSKQRRGAKGNADCNTNNDSQISILHQRLYNALNLGTRFREENECEWKWKCTDIETQRVVVRSISAFLDSVFKHNNNNNNASHPLLKDSVADICKALVWILPQKNLATITIGADVLLKMMNHIHILLRPYMLDFVRPLSSLLSFYQLDVSTACATSLNIILLNIGRKKEKDVWEILKETDAVRCIVGNTQKVSNPTLPVEYFVEMAFLLSTILDRCPSSRFYVWNNVVMMRFLETIRTRPNVSVKVSVLKIYSALALCGYAAKKLLENAESLSQYMVHCMGATQPVSLRIEGFRFAQRIMRDEDSFSLVMNFCCEPLVEASISGLTGWDLHFEKVHSNMCLVEEACHLARLIRWEGKHHIYFWKHGIVSALLSLFMGNLHSELTQDLSSSEVQLAVAQKFLNANCLDLLRPFIWDSLGWLATHCDEDFEPNICGQEMHLSILITGACLGFVDSIQRGNHICKSDAIKGESVSRAVLLMIYSPCKYISSKTREMLSQILEPNGEDYLQRLLHTTNLVSSGQVDTSTSLCQTTIYVIGLICYSRLPRYEVIIFSRKGVKIFFALVKWCLNIDNYFERHDMSFERTCCWLGVEEWDGKDALLLYALWGMSELLKSSCSMRNNQNAFSDEVNRIEAQLVIMLQEICNSTFAPGPKWYAAYILSCFGFYGLSNQRSNKVGKALTEHNYADLLFIHSSGRSLSTHGVILAVRCPSLLPSTQLMLYENKSNSSSFDVSVACRRFQKIIRLSAQVDYEALCKLLEFVYLGHIKAGEEIVKKLISLARHCNLQPLSQMLCGKRPKWGAPIPGYDMGLALSSAGQQFCDVVLEAKEMGQKHWTCSTCTRPAPHVHVHKVVLWSSCDYMRALFDSGMEESHSQALKVPVSWEAMIKLVDWFYTNKLPSPPSGCLWDNMDHEERLSCLKPYVELSWLAEYWFLDEVHDACHQVILSCLDSARSLSVDMVQIAANFSQWNLTEAVANHIAPLFCQLRDSGALETLDEHLVDTVRAASVCLSQGG